MSKKPDRLERFRGYVAQLDPVSRLRRADDLYVEPPGRALSEELALRLQLAPESKHLIVGGIGAGKTTQVRRALELLEQTSDTRAVYIDVSKRHDLDKDVEGVLLVLAGLSASRIVADVEDENVKTARKAFSDWAHGKNVFVRYEEEDEDDWEPPDDEPGRYVRRPGILHPPLPPLGIETEERVRALRTLVGAFPDGLRHFVVAFDSLDRITDIEKFRNVATEDVRALQAAGVGVVVVGPSRIVYGANRPVVDLFDQLHVQPALDVESDEAAAAFFDSVLAKRADESVLPSKERRSLVEWSGGVVRDLLGLAHNAVEEAFIAEQDSVTNDHVLQAADRFGRSMMIGLRPSEIETLQRLRRRKTFVPTGDDDLALLESRRVLEYRGVTTRYAVHPTIAPHLASLDNKK